jgi:DNA-binding CsgD family transcriptional regulator
MAEIRASHAIERPPNGGPFEGSTRLQQVLRLASGGYTDKAIAYELGVRPCTIRSYWDRLRLAYGATTRGEIIAKAMHEALEQLNGVLTLREAMLDRCEVAIWTMTSDGAVDYANSFMREFCGLTNGETLCFCGEFVRPAVASATDMSSGDPDRFSLRRRDGAWIPHRVALSQLETRGYDERWMGVASPI